MTSPPAEPRAWWHGCWLTSGHFLFDRNGNWPTRGACPLEGEVSLDGGLAPRLLRQGARSPVPPLPGDIVFERMAGGDVALAHRIKAASTEAPQGEFLLHAIAGCTVAAWWDRTQGDTRSACNSCVIVENRPGSGWCASEVLDLFPRLFPKQAAQLATASVTLRFLQWA